MKKVPQNFRLLFTQAWKRALWTVPYIPNYLLLNWPGLSNAGLKSLSNKLFFLLEDFREEAGLWVYIHCPHWSWSWDSLPTDPIAPQTSRVPQPTQSSLSSTCQWAHREHPKFMEDLSSTGLGGKRLKFSTITQLLYDLGPITFPVWTSVSSFAKSADDAE